MPKETKCVYEFGSYRLDSAERFLYRQEQPIPLPPKVIDTLLVLVENSGRVVEKAVLMETVWPDVVVEENNLTQNVSLLRKTLGDSGDNRQFIETIPRRGYRFIAPVKIVAPAKIVQASPDRTATEAPLGRDALEPPGTMYRERRGLLFAVLGVSAALIFGAIFVAGRPSTAPAPILRQLTTNSVELPLSAGAISPDGKYLAYADPAGLHLKLLKTGETHVLPSPADLAITTVGWFPDSASLLVSGLAKQDSRSGIWKLSLLNEEPRKLWNDGAQAVASPDGSQIVFLTAAFRQLWLMGANGENPHAILTAKPSEGLAKPAWLPTGERIAYASIYDGPQDASGKTVHHIDLESVDRHGTSPIRVAFDPGLTGGILLPGPRLLYALRSGLIADWGETTLWEWQTDLSSKHPRGKPHRVSAFGGGVSPFDFSATSDGRQLVFLKGEPQNDVYVAELEQNGKSLRDSRRLTLDDHNDFPWAWTLDSRAVFFSSDRNGNMDIFRQFLDSQIAQPIVATPQDEMGPTVTPDGEWYLYIVMPEGWTSTVTRPLSWMRIPAKGGVPRDVFGAPQAGEIECALPPSKVCVFTEHRGNDLIVWSLDPEKGKGGELGRTIGGSHPLLRSGLSPDGSRLAVTLPDRIRILSLGPNGTGANKLKDIFAAGWTGFNWVRWAPDGKGLYVACWPTGRTVIGYLDFDGHKWPLIETPGESGTAVFPSPDGRRLAFSRWSSANNAWMMERF
ncbi:MAG: winged helix-turn-helix domain-containing protein [Acidobacteriia bacterium]|nr:winged helix-turn-helix domain-containing protein [Terriglobia bacterium]